MNAVSDAGNLSSVNLSHHCYGLSINIYQRAPSVTFNALVADKAVTYWLWRWRRWRCLDHLWKDVSNNHITTNTSHIIHIKQNSMLNHDLA